MQFNEDYIRELVRQKYTPYQRIVSITPYAKVIDNFYGPSAISSAASFQNYAEIPNTDKLALFVGSLTIVGHVQDYVHESLVTVKDGLGKLIANIGWKNEQVDIGANEIRNKMYTFHHEIPIVDTNCIIYTTTNNIILSLHMVGYKVFIE